MDLHSTRADWLLRKIGQLLEAFEKLPYRYATGSGYPAMALVRPLDSDKEERQMSDAREMVCHGLLLDALGDPVDLNAVDWHVRQHLPSATPSEVQNETLEIIRSLVSDGLFRLGGASVLGERLGGVATEGEQFVPWNEPLDHLMHKISRVYVKHYDDPERWMYSAFMELTDKGEQVARSLEQKDIDSYRKFE